MQTSYSLTRTFILVLSLLLPVQLSAVYWHLIPSALPHSTLASYCSQISLCWDLQSTDFAFFSLSVFSCLHFLWSPVAFYFKLPASALPLLTSYHSPGKTEALTRCLCPGCCVHPYRKKYHCYVDWHLTLYIQDHKLHLDHCSYCQEEKIILIMY